MIPFAATIDEFEQGSWVANIESFDAFDSSFQMQVDGDEWTGTKVNERFDNGKYYTQVIGGGNGLSKVIDDRYYNGSVSLQSALQDICTAAGEDAGTAKAAVFASPYMRLRGTAASALDALVQSFGGLIWWVGRDGLLNLQAQRDGTGTADGTRVESHTDASVRLMNPTGVVLGATYSGGDGDTAKPIRHVRWLLKEGTLSADVYFIPFIFRAPADTRYSSLKNAVVDKDNGDGTIDAVVEGRYGVSKVELYCGVPGSKVTVKSGEKIQIGYFGGDPQKPFAVSMGQDSTATKQAARKGDTVKVNVPAGSFIIAVAGQATGTPNTAMEFDGEITSGTDRIKIGDA